jgi:hypothetical protein
MANPELDRLLAQASGEIGNLIRRAFEAGVKQERARLTALINADPQQLEEEPPSYRRDALLPESPPHQTPTASANYGRVIGAVRDVFHTMHIGSSGIDAGSILNHLMRTAPDRHINGGQVRTALKQLLDREEVVRVERGRFRLSRPALSGEEDPGADPPGSLNLLAAE